MAQGLSTPIPLRSGHPADEPPTGAAADRPRRPAGRAAAMTRQLTRASSGPTTGCPVGLAPVGLMDDAVAGVPAAFDGPLRLAGGTVGGAA
jgi:hypothetical protein